MVIIASVPRRGSSIIEEALQWPFDVDKYLDIWWSSALKFLKPGREKNRAFEFYQDPQGYTLPIHQLIHYVILVEKKNVRIKVDFWYVVGIFFVFAEEWDLGRY